MGKAAEARDRPQVSHLIGRIVAIVGWLVMGEAAAPVGFDGRSSALRVGWVARGCALASTPSKERRLVMWWGRRGAHHCKHFQPRLSAFANAKVEKKKAAAGVLSGVEAWGLGGINTHWAAVGEQLGEGTTTGEGAKIRNLNRW